MDFTAITRTSKAKPLLKWAGGKKKMLPVLIPTYINLNIVDSEHTYFEPFMGSGALAFYCGFNKMVLGDLNCKLINFYKEVRDRNDNSNYKYNNVSGPDLIYVTGSKKYMPIYAILTTN